MHLYLLIDTKGFARRNAFGDFNAKQQGADKDALSVLEQLPDEEYETPADVSKAVGDIE